ncbi:MAG: hypothetical protein ABIJ21_07035 [Nanoarchaeota archaeon]
MQRLENLLAEYRIGLAEYELPVYIQGNDEISALEKAMQKKQEEMQLCVVTKEERDFYDRFRSHLFLNNEKETVRETVKDILEIQAKKADDRTLYDYGATGLKDRHERLLQALAKSITPGKRKNSNGKAIDPKDPLDLLLMKSLDVIIETYKGRLRKNGRDYEVFHPLGMARAVAYLGQRSHLDSRLIRVMQLAALRHDLDEIMQEKIRNYQDPSDYFRSMDMRIRNFAVGKTQKPLEKDEEDILDAATVASIMLTKPPAVFWDESVKSAVNTGTLGRYLDDFFPDDVEKKSRLNHLIRHSVILVKLTDLNYNMVDFDDIRKKRERTFTLKARARAQYKSIVFFNLLSRSAPQGAIPELDKIIASLKQSLMYQVREESYRCLDYILKRSKSGANRINTRYFSTIDDHLVQYELDGRFDKATEPPPLADITHHPSHYRFDGMLYSMQKEQDERQMKKGYERKQGKRVKGARPIRFGNAKSAFDYFFSVLRLSELCYCDPYKIIKGFTIVKVPSEK